MKKKTTRLVCFSFAAYAKTLIAALKSTGVKIAPGLTAAEFSSLETLLRFTFPPDLRSILREGLPISAAGGFPDWRSASPPRILRRGKSSPPLIPVFGDCYVPSVPSEAGNPVFRVAGDGYEVSVVSFDLAGFFRRFVEPVWAAKEARKIEFWTEAAEARGYDAWWFRACMEGVSRRLREGGWCEEDVREMTEMDGCDRSDRAVDIWRSGDVAEVVTWPVRKLSVVLLRAGWSEEDVEYSFGIETENDDRDFVVC